MATSHDKSRALQRRAERILPGGVNSPVRAFGSVGGEPPFVVRGEGARMWDADGNEYIDYVGSWGPLILGHAAPEVVEAVTAAARTGTSFGASTAREVELAEAVAAAYPSIEMLRFVSSGTEATMSAIRLARTAASGSGKPRNVIIKFEGCYHGHADSLLVKAGSGVATLGIPGSAGVPEALAQLTLALPYNDRAAVEQAFAKFKDQIACVIVEPLAANMGVVPPARGFLKELSALVHEHGALLICDEVISGFRLRYGAAYEMFEADPDLVMLGKIIGGGLPVGAIAGRAHLMDLLAPLGPVYQAGTLSGNPLSVRAGLETLALLEAPGAYERLEAAGARLASGLRDALAASGRPGCVNRAGSLMTLFLGVDKVTDADSARRADTAAFAKFFHAMFERGINLPPAQFEALFLSLAHSDADIDTTIAAAHEVLATI